MGDRVTQIKRAIALMLAILMVVTGLPQTAYTVYGAEPDSGEIDLTLEPEAAESEIAEPEVNDAAIVEEEEIVYEGEELEIEETESAIESETAESEEADVEETEITELEVEGDDPVVIFDANGGTMSVRDDNAIGSTGVEGAYTTQTFNYVENETEIYVDLQNWNNIEPVKEDSLFVGWYDSEDGSQPYEITEKKTRTYKAKWSNPVTFDANGGKFTTLDDNVKEYTGEEGAWLTQTFAYWERDDGTLIYSIRSLDDIKPVRENYKFIGWFDKEGNSTWPITGEARTFKAKWGRNLGDAPLLDSNYGSNGLKLFTAGNKVRFSMKVNKSDYEDILNSLDEEKEVLRIYYQYAAQKPVHGGSSTPDVDGYYGRWNTQLINKDDDYTEFPGEAFDAYDYDYLFDGIPTEAVSVRFRLAYVIVEKDDEGSWIKSEDWSNVVGESDYITVNATYVPAATSVALKDKNVLKPVKFGPELTSEITLNKGADINNLSIKYVYDGEPHDSKPDFLDKLEISDGKLKVKAADTAQAGKSVDIIFYNKKMYDAHGNLVPWDQQKITGNKYTITVQNPTWISKTPTAILTSASDVALTFKVGAPSGESFADGNYYVGVGLVKNNNTEKGLKEGLVIDDVHEEFFPINEDGTIPEITINPFRDGNVDGTKVTKLGDGCGTSMNANFCIVMTDGNAPNGGNILAITDVKKCKTITAATKAPYYADKITLKKVNTNLYAGDEKVVATVDFGKNTTFATSDYWEITNKEELKDGYYITVEKSGTNGILVKTSLFDTAPGTYPIKVETVAEGGITAKASINFTVLPTATYIEPFDLFYYPIAIYRKSGKAVSYTVPIEVQDLNNDVIKKPSLKYEIGKSDDDFGEEWPPSIENVEGLSVDNKGRITIAKSFEVDTSTQYVLKTTSTTNEEVVNYALVKIIENNINPAGFTFPETSKTLTLEPETMTLREYYDLGWESRIYNADSFPATFDKNVVDETLTPDPEWGLEGCGVVITDSEGKAITRDLLKEVKIPNPMYIKKAGKVTLSATTIDGKKISKTINIVKDDTPDVYDTLYVWESETYNDPVVLAPDATKEYNLGVGAVYSLWLSKGVNPTVWDEYEHAAVFDWDYKFNTKYSLSGDKLTVKGAKIVSNIHDDCIDIVLTSSKATITRKRGSKTIATYYITNSAFNLDMPKITCDNNKVYAKTDRTQEVYYTFDKAYGTYSPELNASTCKYVNITSTNKAFLSYLDCGISIRPCYEDATEDNPDPLTRVELTVYDDAAQIMKAGTYTFTMELLDNNRKALCKPVKATLKVENLKKKLKYKNKYTMSNKDVTGFFLEYSGADCCESNGEGVRLLNDNIKGKYNNITEYFKVEYVAPTEGYFNEYLISLKEGKEQLPDVKSLTGYVEFWVNYLDGTSELRCEKITINISKSQVYKYKADSPEVALADKANSIENIAIYGNNNQMEIVKAAALDAKTADLLATDEGLIIVNGRLTVKLNPDKITKAGKITLKVNVIPSTSVYKSQDVSAEKSIPVSITITFTK